MRNEADNGRRRATPQDLGLTARQIEVLALVMQGKSNKAICRALDTAEQTVKKHVTSILKALSVTNRTEAVLAVSSFGWALGPPADERQAAPASSSPVGGHDSPASEGLELISLGPAAAREVSKPPLPSKPSLVVLPFANLSADPGQEYFADGMVEDITIALGCLPQLFVIGSTSAFAYKNKAVDVRQVGMDLGVRYVLRGSVRKEGNRLRITSHVSDASDGGHVWADRFEGELDGVFSMQDRVAAHVSVAICPALQTYESDRGQRKPTDNLTAYDLFLRALPIHHKTYSRNRESLLLLKEAVKLDPTYSTAYGYAAWCYQQQKQYGWLAPTHSHLKEGIEFANRAAEIGAEDSESLWMAAYALTLLAGEFDRSLALTEKSVSLNPSSANALWASATARCFLGDIENALVELARARRLEPLNPLAEAHWMSVALAHFLADRFEEAGEAADRSLREFTTFPPALRLKVVTSSLLGRLDEARLYLKKLLAVNPETTTATLNAYYQPLLRHNQRSLRNYLEGLRLAGLPED